MVNSLQTHGINAEIATTNDDGNSTLDVLLEKRVLFCNAPTYFFPRFSSSISALQEFSFSSSFTIWLLQNISQYDLIHVHALFSYPSTIAMTIARLRGIPYITTPHGLLCHWSLQQSTQKKRAYLNIIEQANLNHSYALHLTSKQEERDVLSLQFRTPTFTLPLGLAVVPALVSSAHTRLRQLLNCPLDEPIILFLSRLHHKKGLNYLIPALAKLTDHRFTLVIAGSGTLEYEAEIESMLSLAQIRDRTHLVGFIEGETKDLFLQGSDLFTLTSHSENFGVAVLEAWAAGLPVLLTPGVALASVAQEHNLGYVSELEVNAIMKTLTYYLSHQAEAKAMGDRARQFILENYTWDKIAVQMKQVYIDILKNH